VKRSQQTSPLLLVLLVLALGVRWSHGQYLLYSEKRAEVESLRQEVESLRAKAARARAVEEENRALEARFRSIPWPPDLRVLGASWVVGKLEPQGWRIESAKLTDRGYAEDAPIRARRMEIRVSALVEDYDALVGGIEALLKSRVLIQSIKASAAPGGIQVELLAEAIRPEEVGR